MPSAGIQYDINADTMAYLTYTEGFKAGGFVRTSLPDIIGPEYVDAWEAGLKGSLLDNSLTYSLSLFHNQFEDLQETAVQSLPNGSVIPVTINVGQSTSQGVELGLSWRLNPQWLFMADIGYLDAMYDDFPNAPCTAQQAVQIANCTQDVSGKRKAYAPEWSGNIGFRFARPIGNGMEITFEPNLNFTSSYFQSANSDALLEQSGYAKLDARLGLSGDDGRWELALVGKNLNDRTTASFRNTVGTTPSSVYAYTDRPRSVALQFQYRY